MLKPLNLIASAMLALALASPLAAQDGTPKSGGTLTSLFNLSRPV